MLICYKAEYLGLQARLASLGLQKAVAELRSIRSKPQSEKRKHNKVDYFSTPLRRSSRLKGNSSESNSSGTTPLAKSLYLCLFSPFFCFGPISVDFEIRNVFFMDCCF